VYIYHREMNAKTRGLSLENLLHFDRKKEAAMNNVLRIGVVLGLFLAVATAGTAQITGLAGTLGNSMVKVTNVNPPGNSVTVTSVAGFAIGDTVLIIQMKGAVVNQTNTASFGDIQDIGDAGSYEFATICDVTGTTVTFSNVLLNNYDPNQYVQLVHVPVYQNVVIGGTLTEQGWNKSTGTGGVLVVAARGWMRVNAPVRMNGKGFAGGWDVNGYGSCNCGCSFSDPQYSDYHYASGSCRSSSKGESISDSIPGKEFGRGKLAGGGGGGNDHNSGGGGGSNYGIGGGGGTTINSTCFFGGYCRGQFAGLGGLSLATYVTNDNRLFLGSGGGSGHDNNSSGTKGAYGGGIIILIADSMEGGNRQLEAIGDGMLFNSVGDGAGGGGAGGSIVVVTRAYGPGNLTLNVSGGKGGDNSWGGSATNCKGPGGGGGGGVIRAATAGLPGNYTTIVSGGVSGRQVGATNFGQTNGATNGGAGGVVTNWIYRTGFTPFSSCLLPVEFLSFEASPLKTSVQLDWATSYESNSSYFEVQRSINGTTFLPIGRVKAAGNSEDGESYRYNDETPLNGTLWYRLREVDQNGASYYSDVQSVKYTGPTPVLRSVYPNPVSGDVVNVDILMPESGVLTLQMIDATGRIVMSASHDLERGDNRLEIPVTKLPSGIYFLKVNGNMQSGIRKFVVSK
jgi:hypothetical protein